jgi:hypothetical protein
VKEKGEKEKEREREKERKRDLSRIVAECWQTDKFALQIDHCCGITH